MCTVKFRKLTDKEFFGTCKNILYRELEGSEKVFNSKGKSYLKKHRVTPSPLHFLSRRLLMYNKYYS